MDGFRYLKNRYTLLIVLGLVAACEAPGGKEPTIGDVGPAECRETLPPSTAPADIAALQSPLEDNADNLAAGRRLYQRDAQPVACVDCHGASGMGDGPIGLYLTPRPTNFTCESQVTGRSDGELYWVIRQGSNYLGDTTSGAGFKRPGRRPAASAMRPHRYYLSEAETWQLVLYIRALQASNAEVSP